MKVAISPLEMTVPDVEEIQDKERLAVETTGGEDKADFDGIGVLVGWVIREVGEVTMVPGEGTMLLGEVTMVLVKVTMRVLHEGTRKLVAVF